MPVKTMIAWREFYEPEVVQKLEAIGTLPRYETEIDVWGYENKGDIAREIAKLANDEDSDWFREGGQMTILEPEQYAGTYHISVEYHPNFYAYDVT